MACPRKRRSRLCLRCTAGDHLSFRHNYIFINSAIKRGKKGGIDTKKRVRRMGRVGRRMNEDSTVKISPISFHHNSFFY